MIALLASIVAASVMPGSSVQIVLPDRTKWALLSGLERRLGGKFIVSGIANADETCDKQESCLTTIQLKKMAASDKRLAGATSVLEMTNAVAIGGKVPVAVVSIIWAGQTSKSDMKVKMVVRNPETGRAQVKLATVGPALAAELI